MLEPVKYVNHMGETLELDRDRIFIQSSDLRDFKWSPTTKNNKIIGFRKDTGTRSISLVIKGTTEECIEISNQLFNVMEKDTLAVQYGTLVMGEYYLKCYAVESSKNEFRRSQGYLNVTIKVATDVPYWRKEITTTIGSVTNAIFADYGLDYPFDYSHDYSSTYANRQLINPDFTESDFEITIFGACQNPIIGIGSNIYTVNTSLETGEYLKINSETRTIYKYKNNGQKLNVFNLRGRECNVFAKIEPGKNQIVWDGVFGFDVTLLIKRSEPEWI